MIFELNNNNRKDKAMPRGLHRLLRVGNATQRHVALINSRLYSASASAVAQQSDHSGFDSGKDDPKLWVKSPYPDVPRIVGVEMHEVLYSRISKWPNSPAFVMHYFYGILQVLCSVFL